MTNEEAKTLFEEDLKDGKCRDDCPECNARELAISALEKQIPKKPDYEADGYGDDGELLYDTAHCPHCKRAFEVYYDNDKEFCPDCGQALDWSNW